MGKDTREDAGQYYPGGKVIPMQPHGGGGGYTKQEIDQMLEHKADKLGDITGLSMEQILHKLGAS